MSLELLINIIFKHQLFKVIVPENQSVNHKINKSWEYIKL